MTTGRHNCWVTSPIVGFLGPRGTFTEQALLSQPDLAAGQHRMFKSMPAVLNAVETGELDLGFAAIENSIEGTVNATIDTLVDSDTLKIQREVAIPISMQLFAEAGVALSEIEQVVSFPHATAQCRIWLRENMAHASHIAANSTADAVRRIAEDAAGGTTSKVAAIGNALAGQIYGIEPVASDIQDSDSNQTRFVVVARSGIPAMTGHDRTTIVIFQRNDRPGSLVSILHEFSARQINLTNLASRPTKKGLGDYCFIIDLEGHIADEVVADALKNIVARHADVKVIGSYPAIGAEASENRHKVSSSWNQATAWMDSLRAEMRPSSLPSDRVALVGTLDARGHGDVVREVLDEHVSLSRNEAGCLRFEVTEDEEIDGLFHFREVFTDQSAFESHQRRARSSLWWQKTQHFPRDFHVTEA